MRSRTLLACFFVLWTHSSWASWQNFGPVAACDFYSAHLGLVCKGTLKDSIDIYRDGILNPVFTAPVTQIAIQDSDRAWATDGDSLYFGTKGWKSWRTTFVDSVLTGAPLTLVRATPNALFVFSNRVLYWSATGDTLIPTTGTFDSIEAIDYYSGTYLVAVSSRYIYISTDGGMNWSLEYATMKGCASVFVDTGYHLVFTGGDNLRESSDSGKTWNIVVPPPEFGAGNFGGQVFGSRDCMGTFYVTSSNASGANSTVMRSEDGGTTFESIGDGPGPVNVFETPQVAAWTFDRGSTIFWSWKEYAGAQPTLYISHDGGDGVITDSIADDIFVSADTAFDTLCISHSAPFTVSVQSAVCIPVVIDAITTIRAKGIILGPVPARTLTGNSTSILLSYAGTVPGIDTAVLRIVFHSVEWGISEHRDFLVIANSVSSPPIFVMADSIAGGNVLVGNVRSVSFDISDSGCAPLRIDSIVSSSPVIFRVPGYRFPFFIDRDSTQNFYLNFFPASAGPYLESLEIGTNAGHRFIALEGNGTVLASVANETSDSNFIFTIEPSLRTVTIRNVPADAAYAWFDLLGRCAGAGSAKDGTVPYPTGAVGMYMLECSGHVVRILINGQ